jgi:undecaprenyl-diphosphatase
MGPFQAILLGFVQGLTEFFPVSSSGHLIIFQHALGLNEPEMLFDVCVHVGTLVAIVAYFYKELAGMFRAFFRFLGSITIKKVQAGDSQNPDLKMVFLIIVGSIPTAVIGLGLNKFSHTLFSSLLIVGFCLLTTSGLLMGTRWLKKPAATGDDFSYGRAFLVGVVQGIAVLPGISRSGSTIAAGLYLGLTRETATRYSFLLSLPAVLGALVVSLLTEANAGMIPLRILIIGGASAAVTGYFALSLLVHIVRNGHLHYFAPYCMLVGLIAIIMGC